MMQKNKYDLVEWVADTIIRSGDELCRHCMFEGCNKNNSTAKCYNLPVCYSKDLLIKELIKKYNL